MTQTQFQHLADLLIKILDRVESIDAKLDAYDLRIAALEASE